MISKRLQHIIDLVPECKVLADIGTDHGYIPVTVIKNSKVEKVIASDISNPSLNKAQEYAKQNSIDENFMSLRLGDGLKVLDADEADTIVIAGMGGNLITKMLEESYCEKFKNKTPLFIFQPVQHAGNLRAYLYNNGFNITDEDSLTENGKYYDIILAKKSYRDDENFAKIIQKNDDEKEIFLKYGLINIKKGSSVLLDKMKRDLEKLKNLVCHLRENSDDKKHIQSLNTQVICMEDIIYDTWGIGKEAR